MDAVARVWSLIEAGGWVMYPLLALSVLSVALTIERTLFWIGPAARVDRGWLERTVSAFRDADWPGVIAQAEGERALVARYAARLAADARRTRPDANPSVAAAALVAVEDVRAAIERFAAVHATIITAAPMLGILGTVTGIIQSFRLISGDGAGVDEVVTDPTLVAAGIAEALFTTAAGLVIALVTLFPHALFRAASERRLVVLEAIAAAAEEGVAAPSGAEPTESEA